jgi:hypothetical protein
MAMIQWMISSSTVSCQTTGMKFIVLMVRLHSLDIVTQLLSAVIKFTSSEESILISKDSMISINLISTNVNGLK